MIIIDREGATVDNSRPLEVVRIEEAAKLMLISRTTIERMIRAGTLPTIGTGRLRRVALVDIRKWQEANRNG